MNNFLGSVVRRYRSTKRRDVDHPTKRQSFVLEPIESRLLLSADLAPIAGGNQVTVQAAALDPLTDAQTQYIQQQVTLRQADFTPTYQFFAAFHAGNGGSLLAIEVNIAGTNQIFYQDSKARGWD